MIVKITRQYVVDGFVSEIHECDMFRFTDPSKRNEDETLKRVGAKNYSAVLFKGDKEIEIKFMPNDSIYVMEKGKTVDTYYIPAPPQGTCSPK
jgi:hypothetical protein